MTTQREYCDLLIEAGWVVPVVPHGVVLEEHAVAVSGDRKIESFMQAAGLGEWVLDPREIASLPSRLRALPTQPSAHAFMESTRDRNRQFGVRLRAVAAESNPTPSTP